MQSNYQRLLNLIISFRVDQFLSPLAMRTFGLLSNRKASQLLIIRLKCSRKLKTSTGVLENSLGTVTTGRATSDCPRSQKIGRSSKSKVEIVISTQRMRLEG